MGTFLNPLTYLFGREGGGAGEGREGLIACLVTSSIFLCWPSTFTIILLLSALGRVHCGVGGMLKGSYGDPAPQSGWWQNRTNLVCLPHGS